MDQQEGVMPIQPKVKKIEQYIFRYEDKIGSGKFSTVYSGIDQNMDLNVAVKVVQLASLKSKTAHKLLKDEISILKDLNHPNVIKCLDVITSINNCYIVFEMCEGGDLETLLHSQKDGKFQEEEILRIVYDVYKALLYLSSVSIVHRDLKIANMFLGKGGETKLADFGFATKAKTYFKDISIGSPIYMSPEGLVSQIYSPKTDVWSFGVMIYELVHGQPPLSYCKSQEELKSESLLEPKISEALSPELREFIRLCLTCYPQQRPDVKDLYATAFMKKVFEKMGDMQIPKALIETGHKMESTIASTYQNSLEMETEQSDNFKLEAVLFKEMLSYQEAVALVHYCRLIYKTCKINESKVLIEWLLLMSLELSTAKIDQKHGQSEKLKSVVKEYHTKYRQEYHQAFSMNKFRVKIDDAISECMRLKKSGSRTSLGTGSLKSQKSTGSLFSFSLPSSNISPRSINHLKILLKETEELKKCLKNNRLELFPKVTQIESYLKKEG